MVDTNYLDARARGFDREAWRALRDEMLAREYTSMRSVHRCAHVHALLWMQRTTYIIHGFAAWTKS